MPANFSCCLCQAQIELKIQTSHRIGGSLTRRDQGGRKGFRVYCLQVTVHHSRFKLQTVGSGEVDGGEDKHKWREGGSETTGGGK